MCSKHFLTIQEVSMTIQDFIKHEIVFMS